MSALTKNSYYVSKLTLLLTLLRKILKHHAQDGISTNQGRPKERGLRRKTNFRSLWICGMEIRILDFFANIINEWPHRLYFKLFPNSRKGRTKRLKIVIFECSSWWTSQFFLIHDRVKKLGFLNISLGCTPKFLPIQ